MTSTSSVLAGVGAGVLVLAVALAVRRPLQRRLYAGTGWEEWRATASRLPWRDRRAIYRSTARGRAAPLRLARLALERGEVVASVIARSEARTGPLRWLVLVAATLVGLGLALNVVDAVTGDTSASSWLSIASSVLVLVTIALRRPVLRRQARLTQRSVRLNRALLGMPG
jgi:hypothetical protein